MATLHVIESSDTKLHGQAIALLKDGAFRIGRDPSMNLCIADTSVSRRHASITATGDGSVIANEGSENGVWVNGQRVERHVLADGDRIVIGGTTFRFEESLEAMKTVITEFPPALRQPEAAPQQWQQAPVNAPLIPMAPPAPVAPQPAPVGPPYAPPAPQPAARAGGCAIGCLLASILLLLGTIAASLYFLYRAGYLG